MLNFPLNEGLLCVCQGAVPHVAVIVEALFHMRPDGQPHTKERLQGLSQHMRTGVPEGLQDHSAAQLVQMSGGLLRFFAIQQQQLRISSRPLGGPKEEQCPRCDGSEQL